MKRISILGLVLLLPSLLGFSPAPQADDISLSLQAGIRGWYRGGHILPILVTVDSQNITLDGHLQVRVAQTASTAAQFETTYQTPFNITRGDSKRVFLYVSLSDFSRELQVELLRDDGRVVVSQRTNIQQIDPADILYGVVSESITGAPDVSRYPIGRGRSHQANLNMSDIAPRAEALRALDVLIFADANTAALTGDQLAAIQDWVAGGGHLIVTGGANWQRTTGGLRDLLPTQPQNTLTSEVASLDLATWLRRPESEISESEEDLAADTLITANQPRDDAYTLLSSEGVPLIVRGKYGGGTVDFVAFDHTTEPLSSWSDFSRLWSELVVTAGLRPSWSHGIERFGFARDSVSNVTGFDLPSVMQLAAFLLVYILLIGPMNYLLLSLFKRRELAWFTMPTLIVVFTLFAYFTGFSLRGNDVTVNQVSVIQVWPNVERARVDGVFGVLSPRRTTYDVEVGTGLSLRTIPNVDSPPSINQMTILQSNTDGAPNIPVDAAIMTSFAASGSIPAPAFTGQATLTLRNSPVNPQMVGEVTNPLETPLQDAYIIVDNQFVSLGELEAGETADFRFALNLDRPLRQPLGARVDPARPVFYQNPNFNRNEFGFLCYLSNGPNVVYTLLMQNQRFNCGGGGDDEELRLRRRALMVAAMNNEIDANGGRGLNAYLLGWSAEPPLAVNVSNVGQLMDGTALYIYQIPTTIQASNPNSISLPPGMMTWTLIEQNQPNRLPEISPNLSFQLYGEQGVAIRFTPLFDAPLREVRQINLTIDWRIVASQDITLNLWNWDEGEWQALTINQNTNSTFNISDLAFVGPQNAVHVLVESTNVAATQTINGISITLQGTG